MRVGPKAEFSVEEPIANSSRLALPTKTAPAARSRSITVASNGGTKSPRIFEAQVVRTPRVQIDVLDAERDAAQRRRVAAGQAPVGVVGLRHRFGFAHGDECVEARIDRGDPLEASAGEFARGDFAPAQAFARLGNRQAVKFGSHVIR